MSFLGHTINCFHQAAPTITKGRITAEGSLTEFTINGSIQEATSAELSSIPENRRLRAGTFSVITYDVLITVDDNQYPDLVIYNGKNYEVVTKTSWKNQIFNHNVYLIQEVRSR